MEAVKEIKEENEEVHKKKGIFVPGDVLASGQNYLPGEGTKRDGMNIIATRLGLAQEEGRIEKIIPLAGVYIPRPGNIIVGSIVDITFNGWQLDIDCPYSAFLPVNECRGFIDKREDLASYFDFGDVIVAKIISLNRRGIDLTMRDKGLRKLQGGMIIHINSNKVPRVIGKKGSMISIVKEGTGCDIIVGQNGSVWIIGDNVEQELLAKETINMIVSKSFVEGLTEKVEKFLEKHGKKVKLIREEEKTEDKEEKEIEE